MNGGYGKYGHLERFIRQVTASVFIIFQQDLISLFLSVDLYRIGGGRSVESYFAVGVFISSDLFTRGESINVFVI